MPVPRVMIISTPSPLMAPKPCTAASLATRAGFFQRFSNSACSGKFAHLGCRLKALRVVPHFTGPGNPTETRSNLGSAARSLSSPASTSVGVGMAGVGLRMRSLTAPPVPLSSMAFNPEPPMSIASVMGPLALEVGRVFSTGAGLAAALGFIKKELYCADGTPRDDPGPSGPVPSPTLIFASHALLLRSRAAGAAGSHLYLRCSRRAAAGARRARDRSASERETHRHRHERGRHRAGGLRGALPRSRARPGGRAGQRRRPASEPGPARPRRVDGAVLLGPARRSPARHVAADGRGAAHRLLPHHRSGPR